MKQSELIFKLIFLFGCFVSSFIIAVDLGSLFETIATFVIVSVCIFLFNLAIVEKTDDEDDNDEIK